MFLRTFAPQIQKTSMMKQTRKMLLLLALLIPAGAKNKYDETDKKDVAAIGPADSGRSNGTG